VDPNSLDREPYPDPAFQMNSDPDPAFDDQKLKNTTGNFFLLSFFDQKFQFTYPKPRMSKLEEKPSALKREHPAL
jgi:hypothetical protein